ncbi:hypothetical protein [Ramlibacter sp.]|uniref:hypothetical protein n=1 Tax=Ramlibacter sp. TaxID=1917967 RepID=UPI003D0E4673
MAADRPHCRACPLAIGCPVTCQREKIELQELADQHGQQGLDLSNPAAALSMKLAEAIQYALRHGLVATIHLEPQQPLAMGSYRMVADVRAERERS